MRIRGIYTALIVIGIVAVAGATYWLLSIGTTIIIDPEGSVSSYC